MNKTLLVIDMQNDFVDGTLGTKEAQEIVDNVVEEVKENKKQDNKIYFTQDTHFENYLDTLEGKKLPVKHCIKNTTGWEIIKPLEEFLSGDNIFEKNTFGSIELAQRIADERPDEIELIGLCTDICVTSNALLLRAFLPDTPISVKSNCCAGVTPELHEKALATLQSCQVDIN